VTEQAPHYVAGRIERALAEDDRTHELGVHAEVRGDTVYIRGEVAGERRLQLVTDVVREAAPQFVIRNEVTVAEVYPPGHEETLQ
jgi:hypothetical protein